MKKPVGSHDSNSTVDDEFPGTGRFEVRRRIGAGGMGVVYEAVDVERGERLALKTLRRADSSQLYRLKQEFRALTDLIHPNLVRLHELVSQNDRWFFTMELVDGVDLLQYVRVGPGRSELTAANLGAFDLDTTLPGRDSQTVGFGGLTQHAEGDRCNEPTSATDRNGMLSQSPLTAPQLLRLRGALRQLCEGVEALHSVGILHRDIKPSNVLVTRDERVVLLDFGLAFDTKRRGQDVSVDQGVVGTVVYMSPEQGARGELSPASDWYSVGVVLFEALTGRRPFVGEALQILLDKQQFEPPEPRELVPGVPEDLNVLCRQLLLRDPEKRPSGKEILRRLGVEAAEDRRPISSRPSSSGESPFVGREQHLKELFDAYRHVRDGSTLVVNIQGRSGVGTSALIQRFLREIAASENLAVLSGRCYERESVPYKAVDSLIDALCRFLLRLDRSEADAIMPRDVLALARVFPVLRRVETVAMAPRRRMEMPNQQELRLRAFRALRELLSRLGDRMTLVLAIDDLQWGDQDSMALLTDLLRPPDPPVLLLLLSFRTDDGEKSSALRGFRDAQQSMADSVDVRQLTVEPLTELETKDLALALLAKQGSEVSGIAELVARESGGNPYFVDALIRERQIESESRDGITGDRLVDLNEVLWSIARQLPDPAIRLLEVVSVAGQPLRLMDAYTAAELKVEEHHALDILRVARLVHTTGNDPQHFVETYHDRIRETVVDHLSDQALTDCHRRLAMVLEATGSADAALLAAHCHGAGMDEKARDYFAMAADQASDALAFDRAADLYRTALEMHEGEEALQRQLRRRLGDALANAGRGREAAEQYLLAADGSAAGEELELRRCAAIQSLISGHIDDGLDALRQVLQKVDMKLPETPRRALASLLWQRLKLRLRGLGFRPRDATQVSFEELARVDISWAASSGLALVDTIRGADFQARNLLLALGVGEPYRIARALATEGAHIAAAGGPTRDRAARILSKAKQLASDIGVPYGIGLVSLMEGITAFLQGRWKSALEYCDRADDLFRDQCTGVAWEMDTAHGFALWALFYMGELAELSHRLPRLASEARDQGNLYALNNLGTVAGPMASLAADNFGAAEKLLCEAMEIWSRRGFHIQHLNGLYGTVQVEIYKGCGEAGWRLCQEQWPAMKRSQLLRIQQVRIFMNHISARASLVFAGQSAGRAGALLRFALAKARGLERERGVLWPKPLARLIRAGAAAHAGDDSAAIELLRLAIQDFEVADMLLYVASARRRLGQLLGGDEGRRHIDESDAWMAKQQIRNSTRMVALHAPGFPD